MHPIEEIDFNGWKGLKLSLNPIELIITPEVGGRVISLTLDGIETFFTLPDLHGKNFSLKHPHQKEDLGWLHYGGYKTWLAPQDNWNQKLPFFDLDSGPYSYQIKQNSVELTSPVCRETGIQLGRTVTLTDKHQVIVEQSMTNRTEEDVCWGLWDVTQVKGPGKALFPLHRNSKFDGNIKGYEDEGLSLKNMNDHLLIQDELAILNCDQKENFKYGSDSDEGWICALLDASPDQWLVYLKTFEADAHSDYPHECVSEVFDSGSHPYFELEVHSPLQILKPNETYSLHETWTLGWLPKSKSYQEIRQWILEQLKNDS